jgi:hypothetical protein
MQVSPQPYAPAALPPEKEPRTPKTQRWVSLTASMDTVTKSKFLVSAANRTPVIVLVA